MRKLLFFLCCVLSCVIFISSESFAKANDSEGLSASERLSLARSFVVRIKGRLNQYQRAVEKEKANILPDGEFLFLQPVVDRNFKPDGVISAQVANQKVLLSLRDFSDSLRLAIDVSADGMNASGWYLSENRAFEINEANRFVKTHKGRFDLSSDVLFKDNDIWIPIKDLEEWLDLDLGLRVRFQEIDVKSDIVLPIYAQYLRQNANVYKSRRISDVSLPLDEDGYGLLGVPIVDVSTSSTFRSNSDQENDVRHSANIRTSSDFAYGTLKTRSVINNSDQLALVRARYVQDSLDGNLLGGLNAKRIEVGDVVTTQVPFSASVEEELGVRISNTDSVSGFSRAQTSISGNAIPGWDVELYRQNQLLGVQRVGDDGFYQFSNVDLFQNDTTFRLVFYGLQGEVREESVFVPFDRKLLGQGKGIYDVSVTLDEKNTFTAQRDNVSDPENEGSLNVSAIYERPIVKGVTTTLGLQSSENSNGDRRTFGTAGVSAALNEVFVNAAAAIDDDGAVIAALDARRDFGEHKVSSGLSWSNSGLSQQVDAAFFNTGGGISADANDDIYGASLRVDGPLPYADAVRGRYVVNTQYNVSSGGNDNLSLNANLNAGYRNVSINTGVSHQSSSSDADDQTNAFVTLSGSKGRDRIRLNANYEVEPDSELQSITANYNRRFSNKINASLDVSQLSEEEQTSFQAQLDWQAGFIRLSPSVRYDTDNNFFAGLNTRFGVLRDPSSKEFKFYDRDISNVGLLSAFVYLDKDGDGQFNGEDEPLEGVDVLAPQNGRHAKTDKNGVALFNRMLRLKQTDVLVDSGSLQDPLWIPGFEGVSVIPRDGYVAQVEFPIHLSGEIDGTLYRRDVEGRKGSGVPLRNVTLELYNDRGEIEDSSVTDSGGFYYFSQIPPGRYLMVLNEKSAKRRNIIRPQPQPIEIGYDGATIFGNDIYVQVGQGDIPAAILSDLDAYKQQHPHVEFSPELHDVVLNLGEYNSRLLMSVVWFKLKSRYASVLRQGELFVAPAQSYADVKTGKHTLRVGLGDSSLDEAYSRCRDLMAQEQYCKVEIYPAAMKKASVE